jgi:hypothetical protein
MSFGLAFELAAVGIHAGFTSMIIMLNKASLSCGLQLGHQCPGIVNFVPMSFSNGVQEVPQRTPVKRPSFFFQVG